MIAFRVRTARLLAMAAFAIAALPGLSTAQRAGTDPAKPPALSYSAETASAREEWLGTERIESDTGPAVKIFYAPGRQRRESVTDGQLEVSIVDTAGRKRFALDMTNRAYTEAAVADMADALSLAPGYPMSSHDYVGRETVNGIAAEKWKMSGTLRRRVAHPIAGFLWLAQGNIPVKMQIDIRPPQAEKDAEWVRIIVEVRKLTLGPVDAKLLAPPADFRREAAR